MNKLLFFISFCCLLNIHAAQAKKPTITAKKIQPEIEYKIQDNIRKCGSAINAAGCTAPLDWVGDINVSCFNKHIFLSFGFKKYEILIDKKFGKKGSLEFNHVLKHELTHVGLYKQTIENFYQPMAQALLMQYEHSEKKGRDCVKIKRDIIRLYNKYIDLLFKEIDKQNDLIDGDENYDYQWKQVFDESRVLKAEKQRKNLKEKLSKTSKKKQTKNSIPSHKVQYQEKMNVHPKNRTKPKKQDTHTPVFNERYYQNEKNQKMQATLLDTEIPVTAQKEAKNPVEPQKDAENREKSQKKRKNRDEAERIAFDFIENLFTIVMDEFQVKEKIKNWFLNKQ